MKVFVDKWMIHEWKFQKANAKRSVLSVPSVNLRTSIQESIQEQSWDIQKQKQHIVDRILCGLLY